MRGVLIQGGIMIDLIRDEIECFVDLCHVVGEEVPVYLCGRRSSLGEIARTVVREKGNYTYMADMQQNEKGELIRVCYDKVTY